jgi:hypothetical protein
VTAGDAMYNEGKKIGITRFLKKIAKEVQLIKIRPFFPAILLKLA